ncbi:hypothetical protein [Lactobacillus sp. HT06-2]|uniref:hypothetical protein n=1 Tax=Lactobacillus sp. HT06-2 TaxID=2080222 RepID=UPI000CD9C614|nr:hypothetical protein [Lactobacillus sp. HT06-2]
METKSAKEMMRERQYIRLQKEREEFEGEDCLTVIDETNHVCGIGYQQEYDTYLEFILKKLEDAPDDVVKRGGFTNIVDAYHYFLSNCDDDEELKDFLIDYYDGEDMRYGR